MILLHTNKEIEEKLAKNKNLYGGPITQAEYSDMQAKFSDNNYVMNKIGGYVTNLKIPMNVFYNYYMNHNNGNALQGIRAYFVLDSSNNINVIFSVSNINTEPNEAAYAWGPALTPVLNKINDVIPAIHSYWHNVMIENATQSVGDRTDKISIYHNWSEFNTLFIPKCVDEMGQQNLAGFSINVEFGYIKSDFRGGAGDLQGPTAIYSLWDNTHNIFVEIDNTHDRQYDTGNPCPPMCGGIQQSDVN